MHLNKDVEDAEGAVVEVEEELHEFLVSDHDLLKDLANEVIDSLLPKVVEAALALGPLITHEILHVVLLLCKLRNDLHHLAMHCFPSVFH